MVPSRVERGGNKKKGTATYSSHGYISSLRIFTDFPGQQAIDEKIARHEAAICCLKHQRNLLSAINHLPDEALALIFTASKAEMTTKGAWLTLLRVCQRWRYIILDTPSFWSTISMIDSPFVSTMIENSKALPLTLDFPFQHLKSTAPFWNATDSLLREGNRVREMTMTMTNSFHDRILQSDVILHMKNFEAVSLDVFRLESTGKKPFSLPTSIWSSNSLFTHFRCLELSQIIFPLTDIPNLPSLTTLIIRCNPLPNGLAGLSISWITQFLRHTKNVEHIDLHWISNRDLAVSPGPFPISLTKLRSIFVSSLALSGSKLFDYLELPGNTTITADFPYRQAATSIDLSSLEKLISKFASGGQAPFIDRVYFEVNRAAQLTLRLFSDPKPPFPITPLLTLSFHLVISAAELYVQLLSKLCWAGIPTLTIHGVDTSPSALAHQVLQVPFDVLRTSTVVSVTSLNLFGVLLPPNVPYLPSLSTFTVCNTPRNTLSISRIVRFLRNTPNIEVIQLDDISSVDSEEVTGSLPVQLEKLTFLSLMSDSVAESKIFEYLTFPNSAYVASLYPNASARPDQVLDFSIFEMLVTHICSGPEGTVDEVSLIVCEKHGNFILQVYPPNKAEDEDATSLELTLPFFTSSMQKYMDLVSKIPPALIDRLKISGAYSSALADQWSPLIRRFSHITELTIDGNTRHILELLSQVPLSELNLICSNPKLRTITADVGCWVGREGSDRAEVLDLWKNLFKMRRDVGLPIDKFVVIHDGSVDPSSLDGLREYVDVECSKEAIDLEKATNSEGCTCQM
ncbi:hypothetical protein ONZ45_g13271 [Pleurotus djamor]|nr:hypothetical protein ONZ45_g13271 [Pleurotus djamor]